MITIKQRIKKIKGILFKRDTDILLNAIEKITGIDNDTVLSKSRKHKITYSRHLYCLIMIELKYTYEEVGDILNLKHTSVMHNVRNFKSLMDIYEQDKNNYEIAKKIFTETSEILNL